MKFGESEVHSIAVVNEHGVIVALVNDDDVMVKKGYELKFIYDEEDYLYREQGKDIMLIPRQGTDITS